MSLYKPESAPGTSVARPTWPRFTPPPKPAPALQGLEEGESAAALQPASAPALVPTQVPAPVPAALQAAPPPSVPVPASEYEDIIRQARLEAAQILQEAALDAEQAVEGARNEGLEAGRREGFAAGQAELDRLKQELEVELERAQQQTELARQSAEAAAQAVRTEAEGRAQTILAQAREDAAAILEAARAEQARRLDAVSGALLELAVSAAQRLVQGHLALAPEAIVQMLAAGLRRLKDSNCTVRVSPQDLPLLEAQRSTLERELATGFLQLQADPGLTPGNYIISSPQGHIDGRMEKQLGVVRSALTSALGGTGT